MFQASTVALLRALAEGSPRPDPPERWSRALGDALLRATSSQVLEVWLEEQEHTRCWRFGAEGPAERLTPALAGPGSFAERVARVDRTAAAPPLRRAGGGVLRGR